ncbi:MULTISPECIES: Tat pathway signal sequence domain protein [Streptomyces]|mgnify:FL=1|uniref:Tat pathway signal sequence domain protein n=1 Tax=Streptomyces TaxID=1883 RepID=UPI001878ADC7|nr:Tat pathway signal sequence domain protein [Streptomyces alboflavus]
MGELVRRHLGKVVAGGALAVVATAAMVVVTLPEGAGAGDRGDRSTAAGSARQDAIAPEGVVEDAPEEGEKGIGSDPLTDAETERAEKAALDSNGLRTSARDVEGDRGPQRLSTNLAENDPAEGADAARRAQIVYYDYKKDAAITKTVNLETGKVESTNSAHNVQPPPTKDELTEATQLLIADPLGKGLKQDYKKATGKDLTGPGDLDLSGFIFSKQTNLKIPAELSECGKHRCFQVVAKVKRGPWIDTRAFVVDLSSRAVGRLG